jgi:RND family efflux transporter MFP subunit
MLRRILIAVIIVVLLGSMVFRLATNKSKIDKETSYRDVIENVSVNTRTVHTSARSTPIDCIGLFRPSREAPVAAEIPGKIVKVAVNEGDFVTQGQVLATLDTSSLSLKREADRAQYEHSQEDLARYENLNKKAATTDIQLKQIRLTNTLNGIALKNDEDQLGKSRIRAAISGYLTAKNFEVGMVLSPGVPIGQIANTTLLKFTAFVPEYQVVKLAPGQKVTVHADVFPEMAFAGAVAQIAAKGDENHQYKIEVTVNNTSKQYPLKGGMNGTMSLVEKEALKGIFIPRESVVGSTEDPKVYVAAGGRAFLRRVAAGPTLGNDIQILGGIHEGDTLITTGMNNLKDSTTIKIAGIR